MSRRSGRYERRKAKREANRLQRSLDVGGLKEVFTFHDLYKAGKQCCNAVRWKTVRRSLSFICSLEPHDAGGSCWNINGFLLRMYIL